MKGGSGKEAGIQASNGTFLREIFFSEPVRKVRKLCLSSLGLVVLLLLVMTFIPETLEKVSYSVKEVNIVSIY